MQAMPAPHIRSIQALRSPGCLRPQAGVPCKPRPANRDKTPPRRAPEESASADDSAARRTARQSHPTSCMCAEDSGTAARWRWRASPTPSYARRHSAAHSARGRKLLPPAPTPLATHDREHACAACRLPAPPSQACCDKRPSPGRLSSLGRPCLWSLPATLFAVGGLLSKASRFLLVICRLKTQSKKVFLMRSTEIFLTEIHPKRERHR